MTNQADMLRLNLARRQERINGARRALATFLASPAADDVCAMLTVELEAERLMRETPEATAYALGIHDTIQFIRNLQNQERGNIL